MDSKALDKSILMPNTMRINERAADTKVCCIVTLAWPALVHEKLVDLLVLRRPVALIILAYYGATLDLCRDLWIVGQAGKQLVRAVTEHLGPNWARYLQWPCDTVGINSISAI